MENDNVNQLLALFAQSVEIKNPIEYRNLTLFPLKGPTTELDYILAKDAIANDTLIVKEINDSGNVNRLMVQNKGDGRVLLLDGEELIGAKQNRILNTTILIEANITQKIPVSCVERGRWRHTSPKFSSGMYSPPQMRRNKVRAVSRSYAHCGQAISNQGEVWADVEKLSQDLNAHSPTHAMKDAFDQRAEDFDSYVRALPYPEGSRGIVATISGRFVAIDVLDRPDTFKQIWNRLVTGYAIDALRRRNQDHKTFTEKNARSILDSISDCRVSVFDAVGLGKELRFESDQVLGQTLVVEDSLLHMSFFPNEMQSRSVGPNGQRIMPPSFRRRPRRTM